MTINLFCLPPAGSSAALYTAWKKQVTNDITIVPVEYPGHGALAKQPLLHDPDILAHHIITEIKSHPLSPFMLFGHSVGAALLWRVIAAIEHTPLFKQLKMIIVSGRPTHSYTRKMPAKHLLSRAGLINLLRHYNNVPSELFQNEDAMNFFLAILRNDLHLNDNMLQDRVKKINRPLLVFYGKDDPDIPSHSHMLAWQEYTTQWLGCYPLAGDHFFFNELSSRKAMFDKIAAAVSKLTS
ncbi:thioesterase II family protein [Pseudoalteromonas arctica]|uniref:Thioesterase n=1 Tax=Pseudoalteromonas arctica TaxID=394751 RepID=A0A7Y0DQE4_9GAMM|nr:alpha/beta fold hydrolase [Pseudoalteromonas arctica]NMM39610.1 thioesterase [Pseudoalteromonas arctica]